LAGRPNDPAVIDPADFLGRTKRGKGVRLPKIGIVTFAYMKDTQENVQKQPGLRQHKWFPRPLVDFKAGRRRVACATLRALGAPYATVVVELLLSAGLEELILVGGVGVLSDDVPRGTVILPTEAIRDEGTSYHYVSPRRKVQSSRRLRGKLRAACAKHGVNPVEGKTWTTDAIFRETPAKVRQFREQGAVCVEMEAAACFAVAQHRGIEFGALFHAGDSVARPKWQPRNTKRDHAEANQDGQKLLEIAIDALCMR